ncbi:hypothetical protein [Hathewaya limosa]|uniref:Transposase/invertase (TIGR01784 family) n=1 Tax=Hathewaya limosa TaxID=1536 RepID=A0ABU0JT83_HATLI|nr:hypothetical protein [Hathewaya limosa]MDQ0480302.1 putative transposase/invertase (TIGR01784 family) [Hathewaya limosa]
MNTQKEVELYEQRKFAILDRVSDLENAEQKGLQQGLKKGLQQGKMEGMVAAAKNLLVMNMDLEVISKATGLTIDEIKNLKKGL